MLSRRVTYVILILALLAPALPGCAIAGVAAADGYALIAPSTLQAHTQQAVSMALFAGDRPASGIVQLSLLSNNQEILRVNQVIHGVARIPLELKDIPEGEYLLRVTGEGFQDEAKVMVQSNFLVFVETDKPIYKPGQTIHIRAVTLDSDLMPVKEQVTVEAIDAKGIKVFRATASTDNYGMANLDLPLSTEPNLGVWKIVAITPKGKTQTDVRVEEYVLPKYEVKVNLAREWFLVNEAVRGKVVADYSFGKPVKGDLQIKASRYVGTWQQYANLNIAIDGEAEFSIPAAGYVAGVPAAGGQGNVTLEFTVVEKATGYVERTSRLITVASSSVNVQIIPSSSIFKPELPFGFLVITQTPDNQMIDTPGKVRLNYYNQELKEIKKEEKTISTARGKALVEVTPPRDAVAMLITGEVQGTQTVKTIEVGYSPSGNFIHVEQVSDGVPKPGDEIRFKVYSTKEATNFYYEVVSKGKVVFTDYSRSSDIAFQTSPAMAPSAKLLVYQVLPNSEVAADYIPFKVTAQYPQSVSVTFDADEARPGNAINVNIQADGQAEVGIAVVDRSVFILAENRLNLQQVFDELERLYMQPQAELHEVSIYDTIVARGAKEIFKDAGVIILSNKNIPEGKEFKNKNVMRPGGGIFAEGALKGVAPPMATPAPSPTAAPAQDGGLAQVERVRQFFPETWLWQNVVTDAQGRATLKLTVPDSITTWMLRAVALSKTKGLGVSEDQLKAFQPFFLTIDLPYSAIRGEKFPVRVAVYNYLDQPQTVRVQIQPQDWFDLLDNQDKDLDIKANDIGGAEFMIQPKKLGTHEIKVSAQSQQAADAAIKTILIEPDGVSRELLTNLVLSTGNSRDVDTNIPGTAIDGSGRAYLTVTSSYLTQTIDGLDKLLQMPFGCGEQNMIVLAPDVYITKYLLASGQVKPEIMAKAEKLMLTGYQRELTYRRSDGSFSAFGQSDKEGSLWLTAFVMKVFAQAKDIIFVDDAVLDKAKLWITSKQNADGSFDAVGFVHHQEMLGGLKGKTALTAYLATALLSAGEKTSSAKAVGYLESQLNTTEDPYAVALVSYALELARSNRSADAYNELMKLAKEDENGLHWGSSGVVPLQPQPQSKVGAPAAPQVYPPRPQTSDIEATAYATLALIQHKDNLHAAKAAKWLISKRNAYGGYGSTQDTVVTLQALTEYSSGSRADVDLTVTVQSGSNTQELRVRADNYDVLQIVELPLNTSVKVSARGKGEAIGQVVMRFSVAEPATQDETLKISVDYDATKVTVNDLVRVTAKVSFNPPAPMEAGMTVVDISVPTGFAALRESVAKVLDTEKKVKRFDISGRKVIFYIENMLPGDSLTFSFDVKALYPVTAKAVTSQAYSYYKPDITAETVGRDMVIMATP